MDNAIASLNESRAALGAAVNRLGYTASNLKNINTNLSAARGRILDADYAAESTKLAKQQIIQQAAFSMLAQINASKQYALTLLEGYKMQELVLLCTKYLIYWNSPLKVVHQLG